jgi:hypothetical protein
MGNHKLSELITQLLYTIIGVIILAVANVIVRNLLPDFADDYINIFSGILLLIILGLAWLRFTKRPGAKGWSLVIVIATTLILIVGVGYFVWSTLAEQRTVYFMIDASEHMKDVFEEVSPRIKLNTLTVPDKVDVGLAVFGGSVGGKVGCDDIEELVPPSPKQNSVPEVSRAVDLLTQVKPSGVGNLHGAVLFAISRLAGRRGVQRVTVITSGLDKRCSNLDRAALDTAAAQKKVELELVVLTVGNISESDKADLQNYASRRIYINAKTPDELPSKLQVILSAPPSPYDLYYFGYYGYIP